MKPLLCIVLLLLCTIANAQIGEDSLKQVQMMKDAAGYLHGISKPYNPEKAFELYMQCASQGNAKAMNAVAVQYAGGLGVAANASEARQWYEKAALKGYIKGWANLGLMYRNGYGVEINLRKAFECYSRGADLNDHSSMYHKAYMLYKGLGCVQNYQEAFQLFQQASLRGYTASMYFLGLCYRNGYGTTANADSARHWLSLSALKGYQQSMQELQLKDAENLDVAVHNTTSGSSNKKVEGEPAHYTKRKHNIKAKDIAGYFTGYAIRYDWSGQHVISRSKVSLQLDEKNGSFTGVWVEDDTLQATLEAALTDSALIFKNSQYSRKHHYSPVEPEQFEFKNTQLEMAKSNGAINLAGNIQLYSPKRKEPGKPLYVILAKEGEKEDRSNSMSTVSDSANAVDEDVDVVVSTDKQLNKEAVNKTKLLAYPNPFNNSLNVEFTLKVAGNVRISLLSMEGKIILSKELKQLTAGRQMQSIAANVPAGAYMLALDYGKEKESTLVIKK